MRLPLPFRPDHLNTYALDDGDGWTIVDTGIDTAPVRQAWAALLAGPLAGRPVRRVIVTHHHPDHMGLAGWFQAEGAELWTTRTAWLFARTLRLDVAGAAGAGDARLLARRGMAPDMLAERAASRPFNSADLVAPLPLGFRRIAQGDGAPGRQPALAGRDRRRPRAGACDALGHRPRPGDRRRPDPARASPRTSGSMRPSPTPTPSATGSPPARRLAALAEPGAPGAAGAPAAVPRPAGAAGGAHRPPGAALDRLRALPRRPAAGARVLRGALRPGDPARRSTGWRSPRRSAT